MTQGYRSDRKATVYYIETERGCGLRVARNIRQARADLRREVGTATTINCVRLATAKDVAWVGAMGGYVPAKK